MKNLVLLLVLFIFIFSNALPVCAEDYDNLPDDLEFEEIDPEYEGYIYHFPEIKPEAAIYSGYRFVEQKGTEKAFEYEYPSDSFDFGGDLRVFKYPHRMHFELDVNNREDYFGDVRYALEDQVLFRWFNTTIVHNLNNLELIDLDSSTSSPGINAGDRDMEYGIKTGINRIDLRLKKHDFPLHAYANIMHIRRDGERQQRNLTGSGWYTNVQRTTQSRDIGQETKTYITGINSHLGPLEVDFSHIEKRFDVRDGEVLYDSYTASMFRSAGVFPHNQVSELKGTSNVLRIHTSYTGKLVASAKFSLKERENKASRATEDIFTGTGSVRWMPLTTLSFFLNYSRRDIDAENSGSAYITDSSDPSNSYTFQVKPPVSSVTDTISFTSRYRPVSRVTLKAKYSNIHIDRTKAGLWNLQDTTTRDSISLSADTRILKGLEIKTNYMHREIRNPSYNTEPDRSDRGMVSISWLPSPGINLLASCSVTKDERGDLNYVETENARNRDTRTDNIFGSGTFQILKDLSLTGSYAYMRYKLKQDIVYELTTGDELTDNDVPLEDTAHVYSISLHYVPKDNLSLLTQISHTRSSGEFYPDSSDLTSPVSISSFSQYETTETVYQLSGQYKFSNGFSGDLEIKYINYDDVLDNIHDSEKDRDAKIVLLTISKKWK